MENKFKESRFIEQIMVIGDGQKMPAAFIQPNFNFVKEWAKRHHINIGNNNAEIIANQQVINRIQEEINEINKKLNIEKQFIKIQLLII